MRGLGVCSGLPVLKLGYVLGASPGSGLQWLSVSTSLCDVSSTCTGPDKGLVECKAMCRVMEPILCNTPISAALQLVACTT